MTIKNIEAIILAQNPRQIRVRGLLKKRKESLEEFLVKFFSNWNINRDTIYVDDETVQTEANKRRSLGDIYMICKYYYPNCTIKELLRLLYVHLPDNEGLDDGFRSSLCRRIEKRVWYYDNNKGAGLYNDDEKDEFDNDVDYYLARI
jgi:hypothetical protein